jgi:hypothetical protein
LRATPFSPSISNHPRPRPPPPARAPPLSGDTSSPTPHVCPRAPPSPKAERKMSAISAINPNAERTRQAQALAINVSASRGLAEVIRSNLGASWVSGVRGAGLPRRTRPWSSSRAQTEGEKEGREGAPTNSFSEPPVGAPPRDARACPATAGPRRAWAGTATMQEAGLRTARPALGGAQGSAAARAPHSPIFRRSRAGTATRRALPPLPPRRRAPHAPLIIASCCPSFPPSPHPPPFSQAPAAL